MKMHRVLSVFGFITALLLSVWSAGALYFCGGRAAFISGAVLAAGLLALSFRFKTLVWLCVLMNLGVLSWFISIEPDPDVIWQIHWKKKPQVIWHNHDVFSIKNLRDFNYRSVDDFDFIYRTAEYDISKLTGMDLGVAHWDNMENVGHTLLSFNFCGGRHLALSAETRLPFGMEQGALPGIYKQYEIHYIWATEDDILKLRSQYRKDVLYLYRTNATKEQAEKILRHLLMYTDRIYARPEFYNTLTENCTTSLLPAVRKAVPELGFDYRMILNGRSDEMAFEKGFLAHREGETFQQLKKRREVSQYVKGLSSYSDEIRPQGY